MFIAVEGIDGTGKTTLCARLCEVIHSEFGREAVGVHDPDAARFLGAFVLSSWHRRLDLSPSAWALLFAAESVNAQAADNGTLTHVAAGRVVVSDRSALSTIARFSSDCPIDWLIDIYRPYQFPDLTILLDLDPEVAVQREWLREGRGDPTEQAILRSKRMRAEFLNVADHLTGMDINIQTLPLAPAEGIDEVCMRIKDLLAPLLGAPGGEKPCVPCGR